tara:strand:- start:128 stop:586 length:459 start_codon:yes stop_codon:yes gene_type:complete
VEDIWLSYLVVYFSSMFKFILGPLWGAKEALSVTETALFTFFGSMTIITLIIIIGDPARNWIARRSKNRSSYRVFTKKRRRTISFYKRFNIKGIAFLTPLVLTPIGGAVVSLAFGVKKTSIFFNMLWANFMWAGILSYAVRTVLLDVLQLKW